MAFYKKEDDDIPNRDSPSPWTRKEGVTYDKKRGTSHGHQGGYHNELQGEGIPMSVKRGASP